MSEQLITLFGCLALLATTIKAAGQSNTPASKGEPTPAALALVILYDGSGSMANKVPDLHGVPTPKYVLANNAVVAITKKIEDYCRTKNTTVDAGLLYFTEARIKVGIPLQRFEAGPFREWASGFHSPVGGTPLGVGIRQARNMLAGSHAIKKHILIVTDGESNQGESPQSVISRMKSQQDSTSIYFVAFDVSARVFEPVKRQGATVVSAANELELKTQIDALLGRKILLEAE